MSAYPPPLRCGVCDDTGLVACRCPDGCPRCQGTTELPCPVCVLDADGAAEAAWERAGNR